MKNTFYNKMLTSHLDVEAHSAEEGSKLFELRLEW